MANPLAFSEYFPFDHGFGSASNSSRWGKMAQLWAPNGVVAGVGNLLAATIVAPASTTVQVDTGAAWIQGYYADNTAQVSVDVPGTASGLLSARIVFASQTMELFYNNTVSTPVQNTTFWDLPIALLASGVITDQRVYTGPAQMPTSIKVGTTTIWSGSGVPASGLGVQGDWYYRTDTLTTSNQRQYVKTGASTWVGVV